MRSVFDADVQLTAQQRVQVVNEAQRACRQDWGIWFMAIVHGVTFATAAFTVVSMWVHTGQFAPLMVLPSIVFALVVTRHERYSWQARSQPGMMVLYGLIATLLLILMTYVYGWRGLAGNLAIVVLVVVFLEVILMRMMRPYLRKAMVDLGLDEVCLRCGYRLHGLDKTMVQCPECGEVRYFSRSKT